MQNQLHVGLFVDCESTQPAIRHPARGRRADSGIAEGLERYGLRGTFHVLPTEAEANADLYINLARREHEIGPARPPLLRGIPASG